MSSPYLTLGVTMILIGFLVFPAVEWYAAWRFYGRGVLRFGYRLWQVQRGSWAGLKIDLSFAVLTSYCLLYGYCCLQGAPVPLPLFWVLAPVTCFVARRCLPPAVLYLSTSRRPQRALCTNLLGKAWPYRVVYLLTPDEESMMNSAFSRNNLRTWGRWDWREVVHKIMDMVPIVVVDGRYPNPSVMEETTRITCSADLAGKAIFVTGPDGQCPTLYSVALPGPMFMPSTLISVNEAIPFVGRLLRTGGRGRVHSLITHGPVVGRREGSGTVENQFSKTKSSGREHS